MAASLPSTGSLPRTCSTRSGRSARAPEVPWTKDVPLHGGSLSRDALLALASQRPSGIPREVRHRWAFTYGDQIQALYDRIARDPGLASEIAPGVTLAELTHAAEVEDAMTGEDFLLRRTKLHLTLNQRGRDAVAAWFEARYPVALKHIVALC